MSLRFSATVCAALDKKIKIRKLLKKRIRKKRVHYLVKDKENVTVSWQTFDRWWFKNCVDTTVNTIITTSAKGASEPTK